MKMKLGLCLVIVLSLLLLSTQRAGLAQTKQSGCTAISERDARILIFLIPAAFELRAKGEDVVMEREPSAEQDLAPGKYVFGVYGSKSNPFGSALVGHFGVDKCTGEVTNTVTDEVIGSEALKGVQKITMETKGQ